MTPTMILSTIWLVAEYAMKIVAIGVVPENRRPSSSSAWLLLILFLPVVGFPLYWLIGSPWVTGRRQKVQQQADEIILAAKREHRVDQVVAHALVAQHHQGAGLVAGVVGNAHARPGGQVGQALVLAGIEGDGRDVGVTRRHQLVAALLVLVAQERHMLRCRMT